MTKHELNSASFAAALDAAPDPNYLGSVEVVEGILRNLANEGVKRHQNPSEDLEDWEQEVCTQWANVFLGKDPTNYPPMLAWNSERLIDRFVAKESKCPLPLMFMQFIHDFYRLVDAVNAGEVPDEDIPWHVQGTVETYRNFLLGVPLEED